MADKCCRRFSLSNRFLIHLSFFITRILYAAVNRARVKIGFVYDHTHKTLSTVIALIKYEYSVKLSASIVCERFNVSYPRREGQILTC